MMGFIVNLKWWFQGGRAGFKMPAVWEKGKWKRWGRERERPRKGCGGMKAVWG